MPVGEIINERAKRGLAGKKGRFRCFFTRPQEYINIDITAVHCTA